MGAMVKICLAAAMLLTWLTPAWSLDFSAQVLRKQGSLEATALVYVKEGRLRLEPQGAAQPGAEGVYYIYRQDLGVSWLVYPQAKVYYEAPLQTGLDLSRPPQAGEKLPGETQREDLGLEMVEGQSARKYQVTVQSQGQYMVIWYWYSEGLGLPVKTSAPDGAWSVTYRNVKPGPQPDKLFEPPAGFGKQQWPAQAAPGAR